MLMQYNVDFVHYSRITTGGIQPVSKVFLAQQLSAHAQR